MKAIEERAEEYAWKVWSNPMFAQEWEECKRDYCQGATEQKAIDKELIDMLIDELNTSRAYHLGITGLDSAEEIARKEREGNTALIRGIERTIKYVKEAMEE